MKCNIKLFKISSFNLIEFLIEVNYLLIIFLIPVWFSYFFPTYNIFELNKIIIFKSLVSTLFFLTAVRLIMIKAHYNSLKNIAFLGKKIIKYYLVPTILIFSLGLTLFFSSNIGQSFFGSYERQQGFVSYLFYFIWSLLVFVNLLLPVKNSTPNFSLQLRLKRIIITIVATGSVVAAYGILQIFNIDFLTWPAAPYLTGRALSTFGQPNFLASFLLLVIPLSFYLAWASKQFLLKSTYYLFGALQVICLFLTSSRGALVSFFLVIIIFSGYLLFFQRLSKKKKISVMAILLVLCLVGVFLVEMFNPGRFKELLNTKKGSLAARVFFFQAAADASLNKPMFGNGLENSSEIFIQYYERDWGIYGPVGANADRAHNLVLDTIVTTGFVGLFFMSLWYYFYFRLGFQEIKKQRTNWLALALTLGALGYFLSLMFSFSLVTDQVYFWLFFSLLAVISCGEQHYLRSLMDWPVLAIKSKSKYSIFLLWLLGILLFILSFWQVSTNVKSLIADYYQNKIYVSFSNNNIVEALVFRQWAIDSATNPIQREQIDYFVGNHLSNYCVYDNFTDLVEREIVNLKLNIIQESLSENTYQLIFIKAKIASCLKDDAAADYYFQKAIAISPELPLAYAAYGYHMITRNKLEEAEKYYKLADINLPDLKSPFINSEQYRAAANYKFFMYTTLGNAYFKLNNFTRANKFFQEAYLYYPEDFSVLKKIADCYYLQGDTETALEYVLRGRSRNPGDYNWWVASAALQAERGLYIEAVVDLEEAIKLAPENDTIRLENLMLEYKGNY